MSDQSSADLHDVIADIEPQVGKIDVGTKQFEMLNFAESLLWLHTLELVNAQGLPDNLDAELAQWADRSFRLSESTKAAAFLRKNLVDRSQCMQTNRKQGTKATFTDLRNAHRLLLHFQQLDHQVTIPTVAGTLAGALS